MENKKQLVIVPPMSEPLQKLNEVLTTIATDENIEISLITDNKELTQFLGSAGQCLLAFSNAKLCATFLQENRFVLAKTHSKVILFTPKEIPAKTLAKFTKIGLTEAILETFPPKTLLYKVKLLLRSIKTTTVTQEDKDQVIKSMLDTKDTQNSKEELKVESKEEEASVNYMAEERAKFKKSTDESSIDYGENLKGKNATQEDAIETHWKSKRKTDDSNPDLIENDATKIEDDPSSIDMYYRGKRKTQNEELLPAEDIYAKKPSNIQAEEEVEEKKRPLNIELDLIPGKKEKNKYLEEEEEGYSLKTSKNLDLIDGVDEPIRPKFVEEENEEESKKKELDELEALFEAAKKRQAEASEDIGGHYKGKIAKVEEEEEPEITESKEYDNSDLSEKEKSVELDLIAGDDDSKKRQFEEEEQEEKKSKGFKEEINSNMTGEEGQVDKLNTRMISELGEDSSKKIRTKEIYNRDTSYDQDEETKDNERESKKEALTDEEKNDPFLKKKELEKAQEQTKEKNIDLDLLPGAKEDKDKIQNENENKEDRAKSTNLKLVEGDSADSKTKSEEEDDGIEFKKLDNTNLNLEKGSDKKSSGGKVDKIDTFYRSGESKKKEHNWDNLDEKRNVELALEKGAKREDLTAQKAQKKDNGEVTIDYRKLKEEFEAISRGDGETGVDGVSGNGLKRNANDDEDRSFKVVELDARGFDFSIEIINLLYQKDTKPLEFYKIISDELISRYKGFSVFYTFKNSDKKHIESFNTFTQSNHSDLTVELKDWWQNHKEESALFQDYYSKSMTTWICRELKKDNSENHWEDIELPTWAINELTNKKVELVFPYYDGVDRMGVAFLLFPNGLNPKQEKSIEVTLELARTLQLDTIQRKSAPNERREENAVSEAVPEKKKILSMFSGMFKGKKAG